MFYNILAVVAESHREDGSVIEPKKRAWRQKVFTVFSKNKADVLQKVGCNISANSMTHSGLQFI